VAPQTEGSGVNKSFWIGAGTMFLVMVALLFGLRITGADRAAASSRWTSTDRLHWKNGGVQDADGNAFDVGCVSMTMIATVHNVGRLEGPDDNPTSNRMITYRFDNGPEQKVRGGLEKDRLEFRQWSESAIETDYGQDIIAELIKHDHNTITIKTTDGNNRPVSWQFNVAGAKPDVRERFQNCERPI
jgi:hypothetical protein